MDSPGRPDAPRTHWHALAPKEAIARSASHSSLGLTRDEVAKRFREFGPNALPEAPRTSLVRIVVHQFQSPLIFLLFLAAGVALVLGHRSDAGVIALVVLLNAVIGAIQEGRAERSLAALRRLASLKARVIREGQEELLEARDVVPGDLLLLGAGDAVAADAKVLDGAALQVAEAALTGESLPVSKDHRPLAPDTPLGERANMVYAGTHVTAGRGLALVVATGLATEIGRIARLTESVAPAKTPLEQRVHRFSRFVLMAAAALFLLILAVGWWRELPLPQILMIGISQVVGMVPEGLPVAMTIGLAVGVYRMSKRNAIIRRLSAVETLGSITVICTDKTGTLTRNEMTVVTLVLPDGREARVSGTGYAPVGEIDFPERDAEPSKELGLHPLLRALALCNDAQLVPPTEDIPRWIALGDPTEAALITLVIKAGLVPEALRKAYPRKAEIPFDSAAKMMATQHAGPDGPMVYVKGAPEAVMPLCRGAGSLEHPFPWDLEAQQMLREQGDRLASKALRLLAVAVAPGAELEGRSGFENLRGKLRFLGLVGQMDPPRPEAEAAVKQCQRAGIRPVMVTGDYRKTGLAVARALGIAKEGDEVLDGVELDSLSEEELGLRLSRVSVFARVHPAQKLRIVSAYQALGHVVAMTGDGVNDAPALSRADVGVAMGRAGTEVAKEAAKMVITDDDFATIVSAVEGGRVVYQNLKKVLVYLLSTATAAVLVLLLALVLGYPPPLAAVQILWINLVTEGTVTANLVMDPAEGDEMQRPPIPSNEPLLSRGLLRRMVLMTPAMVVSTFGWFAFRQSQGLPFAQVQTETFTVLAVCQWFNVLNCRSQAHSALNLSLIQNPWLLGGLVLGNLLQGLVVFHPAFNRIFHTVPIDPYACLGIGVVASLVLWVEEIRKAWLRRMISLS